MGVIKIVTESEHEEFLRKKSREVTEITPRVIEFGKLWKINSFTVKSLFLKEGPKSPRQISPR